MTPEQLQQIETRCNAATPGQWYQVGPPWSDGTWVNAGSEDPHSGIPICEQIDWDACEPESVPEGYDARANMAFIAHARSDVPILVAAVRELQEKYNLALDDLNEIGTKVRELQEENERLKATLEMVLDGEIISNVLINVGEYDNCYAHIWHGDTHVGPYPTRLDAVLALADELGL